MPDWPDLALAVAKVVLPVTDERPSAVFERAAPRALACPRKVGLERARARVHGRYDVGVVGPGRAEVM